MGLELFIDRKFSDSSLAIIEQANSIIADYQAQGFTLTLRQLYYQFVSRDLIANKQSEYKRLGSIINDGRLAGLVDWDAIEDRTRNVRTHSAWDDPSEIIQSAANSYAEDLWADQTYRPEVWIEKDALIGVIEPVCHRFKVPYFACRGYSSQSEQWRAGKRFADVFEAGQTPIVLHLGDHDPSGIDMTRDNADRLTLFAGEEVEVKRLALNFDQIRRYRPPPNPAKETDSRAASYIEQFGGKSWELDALDPKVIDALISSEIEDLINPEKWEKAKQREARRQNILSKMALNWSEVEDFIRSIG